MVVRTPDEGLQPQAAVDRAGLVHVVYFKGPAAQGDLFYTRLNSVTGRFSGALRVNTHAGSAIATGTVRGAHVALGRNGRVHVAWMGSSVATHRATGGATPMLYARMNDAGTAFEPERNLLQFATGLDGGGSIAADASGRVYVAWHAGGPSSQGEGDRRVWVARSKDDGRTFAREVAASPPEQGACGCCGMRAAVDSAGTLFMLFRSAREMVNRDTFMLTSRDHGVSFIADKLHGWNVGACQMSTYALAATGERTFAAWETAGQVHWLSVDSASGGRSAIPRPMARLARESTRRLPRPTRDRSCSSGLKARDGTKADDWRGSGSTPRGVRTVLGDRRRGWQYGVSPPRPRFLTAASRSCTNLEQVRQVRQVRRVRQVPGTS